MKTKRILSILLVACLLMGVLPGVSMAEHTHTFGAATKTGIVATHSCTSCSYTETAYDQKVQVVAPEIGESYYLAANVEGVLKYFTTGTVTTTAPYSLVTTERESVAVKLTTEDSLNTSEKFEGGFQFTFDNNGALTRIYCMDVLKDATTAGQTGIMDTGTQTGVAYKNRHSFFVDEVNGVKVLRKYGNNNILVVKLFDSTGTYRMLGVPEAELANEGVYPVMILQEHAHTAGGALTDTTDSGHIYGCWCGGEGKIEAHTYGAPTHNHTAKITTRTCTACGYVAAVHGNSQAEVKYPTIGETYNLVANVNGTLYSFIAGGVTETSPYSLKTSTTLATVTVNEALETGKGEFQLVDASDRYIYSVAAGVGLTTSVNYVTYPDKVSFYMDTVNGERVIRAYGTNQILAAKYSDTKSAWRIFPVEESEIGTNGIYPVMLTTAHTQHIYGAWEFDEESGTQSRFCTACGLAETLHGTGTKATQVKDPAIGSSYHLAANVDGTLQFFRHGTVTDTVPYSLVVTDNVNHNWAFKLTLEDPSEVSDATVTTGFQLMYTSPATDTTARIYCIDTLKDATVTGQTGIMDTGANSTVPYKNRHNFFINEEDYTIRSTYKTDHVLVVKQIPQTVGGEVDNVWRMLFVPETDLENEDVYPVMFVDVHEHTYGDTYEKDADSHWQICDCGSASQKEAHDPATGTCTVCGQIPLRTPSFDGNAISLEDTFSLHFYVKKAAFTEGVYQDPSVTFQVDGTKTTVSAYTETEAHYIFTYSDITPDEMGKTVTATLQATKDDGTPFAVTTGYSVARYCYDTLEDARTGDALRTLLVDTLNFGAACQQYRNSTAELVNAALTEEQKSWGSSDPLRTLTSCKAFGNNNGQVKWYGVSALMGDRVQMRVYFEAESAEDLCVKAECAGNVRTLTEVKDKDGRYYVDFGSLAPTQMSEEVTFTVYRGETAVSTELCYSLESYAASWLSREDASTAQKALVTAMIRYGDAAKAYAQRTYDLQSDVLYLGRTYNADDTRWFNWSAAGFSVQFQGSGLKTKIASNAPNANNYAYLKVYVDGVEQEDIRLNETLQTVTLAEGLDPAKTHTVEVRKRNSPRSSTAGVVSMELLDGQKLAPPAAKERLIEFVGDSLTVGYSAADADKAETAWSTKTEDGTKTYSKQVADALSAEYMVTAISGRGVVMNNAGGDGYLFPEVYPQLDIYNVPGTAYDFTLQPDVVVINLGTNDATNTDLDLDVFREGVVSFIRLVRQKNPNAKIIWAYGMRTDKMTTQVDAQIQAAVAQINAAGDNGVYYLALPLATDMHLNHPTAAAYEPSGEVLIEKIEEITGWQ